MTKTVEAFHRGGLARPVGSEQAEDLAPADVEGDAVDGREGAVGLAKPLDLDHRVHRLGE
jgi:hypothetical protein